MASQANSRQLHARRMSTVARAEFGERRWTAVPPQSRSVAMDVSATQLLAIAVFARVLRRPTACSRGPRAKAVRLRAQEHYRSTAVLPGADVGCGATNRAAQRGKLYSHGEVSPVACRCRHRIRGRTSRSRPRALLEVRLWGGVCTTPFAVVSEFVIFRPVRDGRNQK